MFCKKFVLVIKLMKWFVFIGLRCVCLMGVDIIGCFGFFFVVWWWVWLICYLLRFGIIFLSFFFEKCLVNIDRICNWVCWFFVLWYIFSKIDSWFVVIFFLILYLLFLFFFLLRVIFEECFSVFNIFFFWFGVMVVNIVVRIWFIFCR